MARVLRQEAPTAYAAQYRKAIPALRRDFGNRCAYCLIHDEDIGRGFFTVDHFRPRRCGGGHDYANLYYCCWVCNRIKHDKWPSDDQAAQGIGFCDPCREWDYGFHFVEGTDSSLGVLTDRGGYHVRAINLNRQELVEKRQHRDDLIRKIALIREALTETNLSAQTRKTLSGHLDWLERSVNLAIPRFTRREL